MTKEKHKVVFKGVVKEVKWGARISRSHGWYSDIDVINTFEFKNVEYIKYITPLKYEDIWSGEIYQPVLKVGEKIYINDLDIIVSVTKKYRTTNDEIIYETSHDIKNIETDETERTRLKIIEYWFDDNYSQFENFEQLKSEFIKDEIASEEDLLEEEKWTPSWEKPKNKEKTWFGWLKK